MAQLLDPVREPLDQDGAGVARRSRPVQLARLLLGFDIFSLLAGYHEPELVVRGGLLTAPEAGRPPSPSG